MICLYGIVDWLIDVPSIVVFLLSICNKNMALFIVPIHNTLFCQSAFLTTIMASITNIDLFSSLFCAFQGRTRECLSRIKVKPFLSVLFHIFILLTPLIFISIFRKFLNNLYAHTRKVLFCNYVTYTLEFFESRTQCLFGFLDK